MASGREWAADLRRSIRLGWMGLLALLVWAAGPAAAQPEPQRNWADAAPAPAAQYWADAAGTASLELAQAAFQAGQGRPAEPARIMPLGGDQAVW